MTAPIDRVAARLALRARDRNERLAHIERLLGEPMSGRQLCLRIAEDYAISERQAYVDLAEVYARIAADGREESAVRVERARAFWDRRIRRLEARATAAFKAGKHSAAASFESAANYAADRKMKLDGLYPAKKLELSGSVNVNIGIRVTAVVGILDEAGLAALSVVMQQVEGAKARGLLKETGETS